MLGSLAKQLSSQLIFLSALALAGCGKIATDPAKEAPGAVSVTESKIEISDSETTAGKTITATLYLVDIFGDPLADLDVGYIKFFDQTTGDSTQSENASSGQWSSISSNGEGAYTATFKAKASGQVMVSAKIQDLNLTSAKSLEITDWFRECEHSRRIIMVLA